jgi:hypothetical protein
MGERGPVNKRRRLGHVSKAEQAEVVRAAGQVAEAPEPDEDWHPVARRWFESLGRSGQAAFYQASDWETAWVLAESISRELKPQPMVVGKGDAAEIEWVSLPPKGASLAAWLKGFTALLATEGDRRRARVELTRPGLEEAPQDVSELDEYRRRLRSG